MKGSKKIKRVAVVGTGIMGAPIAQPPRVRGTTGGY